jgi:hypothetical protein
MFLGSKLRRERMAVNLTAVCEPIVLDNVGSLTSHNPTRPVTGISLLFFFYLLIIIQFVSVKKIRSF